MKVEEHKKGDRQKRKKGDKEKTSDTESDGNLDENVAGPSKIAPPATQDDIEIDNADEADETLVHESLKPSKKQKSNPAKAYVPPNESQADKDRRTIFVGNLPIEVAKSKVRRFQD